MLNSANKAEAKQLLLLGIPSIIAQLAQAGLGVIDTVMAGHFSSETLAAIALGNNLYIPALVLVIGIMLILNPTTAQFNGEENFAQMRRTFHNGIYLALLISIPGVVLMNSFGYFLSLSPIDPQMSALADEYLRALAWGFPGLALFFVMRFTNEGMFANKIIMYVAISSLPLNVLLNYCLMYGNFGFPQLGAVGTGYATTIVYYYMFIVLFIFTGVSKRYRHIRFLQQWKKPDVEKLKEMLKLGIPMGMSIGLEVALFAAVGLLIAVYGTTELAAHQIAINISSVTYMIPLGLSMAITARVGYHIGKGSPHMSKSVGSLGLGIALLITIVNSILLIGFPALFVGWYSSDAAVVALATQLLFFAALFQLSDGIQVASLGALRGLKDTKVPMFITGFSYWVIGFPSGYLVAEYVGWGIEGYWLAMITSLSIAAVLLTARFFKLINLKMSARPLV